ncbi:MAG TPA: prepilin-type N-terminal cleavage/methylation domain-containing protein [Sporichthyaceae bacterium]|jgi:prepilin-type N-terminal cleavage/methylation domain-containing protein
MYRHIRKSLHNKDKGFTLIELLIVIIIIGILAAIAIPIFLHQRERAVDASAKSDAHSLAVEMESFYTDAAAYPSDADYSFTAPDATIGTEEVRMSPGNVPNIYLNSDSSAYCISIDNPGKATRPWVWQSDNGGLQVNAAADCAAYTTALS